MKGFIKNSYIGTKIFIEDNIVTVVFITLFTIGCLIGSFSLYFTGEQSGSLVLLIRQYFDENSTESIVGLMSRNIISTFLYLAVMYIGGLCAIGLPFVGGIPLVKGIAMGTIISYQYLYSGIKGFLYTFVLILLPSGLLLSVFNFAYTEGIYMSFNVSNGIFNGKPRQVKYALSFLTFTKRFILFSLAVTVISLFEAVLSSLFAHFLIN